MTRRRAKKTARTSKPKTVHVTRAGQLQLTGPRFFVAPRLNGSHNLCMATSGPTAIMPSVPPAHQGRKLSWERPPENIWRAPLVPAALALTAGIVLDRYAAIPLPVSALVFLVSLVAWLMARVKPSSGLPLIYLAVAVSALGAAYHHWQRDWFASDDIGVFASPDARPIRLRGVLLDETTIVWKRQHDPLRSIPRNETTRVPLQVTELQTGDDWLAVSGRVQLVVAGQLAGKHVGDVIEVTGQLRAPIGPENPGGFDHAAYLRDQGIRAQLIVRKTTDAVTRLEDGSAWSPARWLALLRGWAQRTLQQHVPE